ncbi:MAG: TniQ family protein [Methylocystaceae bacterium]|nr:TniQ family protein [Methylocystaceae bacterium]
MCSLHANPVDELSAIKPLLITPRPHKGESYQGYILRISYANGYHSPTWMMQQLGIRKNRWILNGEIKRAAVAFNISEDILRKMVGVKMLNQPKWSRIMGHEIHNCTFESRYNRICPKCLKDHGWSKSVWELKPYICCPEHGEYLVERCPKCGKPISWNREQLIKCKCGQRLDEIVSKQASKPSIQMCKQIEALFNGKDLNCLPEPFAKLDLSEMLNYLLFLGTYYSGKGTGMGRRFMSRLTSEALIEVFERVAAALFDWPNSFYSLLDDIRHHSDKRANQTGLEAEFKTFYTSLFGKAEEAQQFQILKNDFADYISEHWAGGALTSKTTRLNMVSMNVKRYLTLAEAAKFVGLHPAVLKKDIERGHLKAVSRNMKGRTLRMICRDDLERYRNARKQLVDKVIVTKRLGVSKNSFMRLVNDGVLKAVRGPNVDGSSFWFFDVKQIDNLYFSLLSGLPKRKQKLDEVTFKAAVRKATARGLTISDLVQAMLAGTLKASCRLKEASGISGLCFNEVTLQEYFLKNKRSVDWGISIEKAACKLALNEEATRDLVRVGLLKTTLSQETGRLNRLISFDAIEKFKETYISASELAIYRKTSPRAVVEYLHERDVDPVTGPCIDGCRQYFYERKQVMPYSK